MEDFLVFLAQALRRAGESLDAASPLPWPLLVAVLLPFYALALSVSVWWMRGSGWPSLVITQLLRLAIRVAMW